MGGQVIYHAVIEVNCYYGPGEAAHIELFSTEEAAEFAFRYKLIAEMAYQNGISSGDPDHADVWQPYHTNMNRLDTETLVQVFGITNANENALIYREVMPVDVNIEEYAQGGAGT